MIGDRESTKRSWNRIPQASKELIERLNREEIPLAKPKEPGLMQPMKVNAKINLQDYIKIPDTNTLISKRELYQGKKFDKTHKALNDAGLFMPSPALFMPYFLKVRNASHGKLILYDGLGNSLSKDETENLWKYLSTDFETGCWTWLDAKFVSGIGFKKMNLLTHKFENGKLKEDLKPLEECLFEDCFADLEFNGQNLLTEKCASQEYKQGKNVYFWYPRENAVARFGADSGRANLSCSRNPSDGGSHLGVFACAEAPAKKT